MKIGSDIDGILTFSARLAIPWWISGLLAPFSFLLPPNKEMVEFLKKMSEKHEIFIISSRPKFLTKATRRWVRKHEIPHSQVYCVGGKNKKIKTIKENNISIFFDDRPEIKKLLKEV